MKSEFPIDRFVLWLAAWAVKVAVALSLTGCDTASIVADEAGLSRAAAMIAVIDADEDTWQPQLPDSLDKKGGASEPAGEREPTVALPQPTSPRPPVEPRPSQESIVAMLPKAGWAKVHFYCRSNCQPCEAAKAALLAAGIPLEVGVRTPAWVTEFPTLCWRDPASSNGWSYQIGFEGFESFFEAYSKTLNQVPPPEAGHSPTPLAEVRRLLAILRPQPHETFVDYGCGDGRWLIEAARTYGCRAVGIEIDPAQAARARQAVADAGLNGRVQVIEGDAATVNVQADVGVAYLYGDTLERLKPKLLKLNRFGTYMHRIEGIPMQQYGDSWVWSKPRPVSVPVQQQRYAYYGGQAYSGRVCSNPRCSMCASIARQLGGRR